MTQGRGLPERTGSTFPTKLFRHQRAHILGAVPIAKRRAQARLGQRRPPEQNIFLTIYPVDNSCTGLSGKRKSGPKTGTYGIPKGDCQNITLVGVKVHAKIIRSSQTLSASLFGCVRLRDGPRNKRVFSRAVLLLLASRAEGKAGALRPRRA